MSMYVNFFNPLSFEVYMTWFVKLVPRDTQFYTFCMSP